MPLGFDCAVVIATSPCTKPLARTHRRRASTSTLYLRPLGARNSVFLLWPPRYMRGRQKHAIS